MINAEKSDVYDVLAYIAFALAPITRSEQVEAHEQRDLSRDTMEGFRRSLEFVWRIHQPGLSRSWTRKSSGPCSS